MSAAVWDRVMDLPVPPIDTIYNETAGFWAIVGYLIVAVPVTLYAPSTARASAPDRSCC